MDYTVLLDLGQAGSEVEIEIDVDDDYIHEYVTENNCADWARQHFEFNGDVHQLVVDYIDVLDEEQVMELVAARLGVEK